MTKVSAASIRQKILNKSKADKRPFTELLQYYAMERFLYRLSQSQYADQFILKGALMLRVWGTSEFRPTKDIDMLGVISNDEESIRDVFIDILNLEIADGLEYDTSSIRTEQITEDADYRGVRVLFNCKLTAAKITVQIDIGFGDQVFPEPKRESLPVVLDQPAPVILCYSRESSIAEKFDAMLSLGSLSSRMKDFYDIWLLSQQFVFNGRELYDAITKTLSQRQRELNEDIEAFTPEFVEMKQVQWKAFIKRMSMVSMPDDFSEIVDGVKEFLNPVADAIKSNEQFSKKWISAGSWK